MLGNYFLIGFLFLVFFVIIMRDEVKKRRSTSETHPFEMDKVFSETSMSFWHPTVRDKALKIMSICCVVIFIVRSILLIVGSVYPEKEVFYDWCFLFWYYLLFEFLPFVVISIVFSWTPKLYSLEDYNSLLYNNMIQQQYTSVNCGNE